jgi:hypothetical protein
MQPWPRLSGLTPMVYFHKSEYEKCDVAVVSLVCCCLLWNKRANAVTYAERYIRFVFRYVPWLCPVNYRIFRWLQVWALWINEDLLYITGLSDDFEDGNYGFWSSIRFFLHVRAPWPAWPGKIQLEISSWTQVQYTPCNSVAYKTPQGTCN